ncbi:hypothetical protein AK812_SmicGene33548 [Symbiodinium microadriaticum]|uniref:Uncharacterized protein n=1 Tax=Symbiodinium microadriaticum TaxID=2951 RepID=A0A1Q9CR97_SYMMI|nr:hypothetical protein AK812_SmicGene33548 [Symbiodinium microadriaticum]
MVITMMWVGGWWVGGAQTENLEEEEKGEEEGQEVEEGSDEEEKSRDKGTAQKFKAMRSQLPDHIDHFYDKVAEGKASPREFRTKIVNELFEKLPNGRYRLTDFQVAEEEGDIYKYRDQTDGKEYHAFIELTPKGTYCIESAQMLEEEEYEELAFEGISALRWVQEFYKEKVKEKKEIEASPPPAEGAAEEAKEGEAPAEGENKSPSPKKEPEKKDMFRKKRTKRTDIPIAATDTLGLPQAVLQKQEDEETAMQADMKEIIETDEKRNDLESYILTMRVKSNLSEDEIVAVLERQGQEREKFDSDLLKAEDTANNRCQ